MSKADKLRKQRADLIIKLQRERNDEVATRAEIQRQIDELEERRAKKKRNLDALAAENNKTLAELDRKIAVIAAAEKVDQLRAAAAELDSDGHSPERLARFERLCTELAAPTVNHFAPRSHEARQMAFRRMKRDVEVAMFRPPYQTWSELVEVNIRPIPGGT
jgi:hypothetical protein